MNYESQVILKAVALGLDYNDPKVKKELIEYEKKSNKRRLEIQIMSDIVGEIQDKKYCSIDEIRKIFEKHKYDWYNNLDKENFYFNEQARLVLIDICANYDMCLTSYNEIYILTRKNFLEG